ncbi:hypothetical protein [Burkholderia gladioli]|uniref:hypothetical protein n=1 Tax=Burkholderia gladioli TaxID=28095 RepID=UPI0016420757|nr:hypothetical protein [Burkholderia gladioli]MDN7754755.1 hypothetical protein [Burkholderia gladioli]
MTVEELRVVLKDLPGDLPICLSFPDFKNDGMAYETRDVRVGGQQDSGAGEAKPCFILEAWGGV